MANDLRDYTNIPTGFQLKHTSDGFNDSIHAKMYKSVDSGMKVILVSKAGPTVHADFIFATEASDDDGIPHSLEHLIFMGSQKYSYKGVLDLISNRCFASGTNAQTWTDYTTYTVKTVSFMGLLQLLPVYLDHMFYPTLQEHCYLTEIHHITRDGKDAGVMYCEIQASENTDETILLQEMQRSLYPPDCGYRYDTGGVLSNIRESLNLEKIQRYHKKMYHPSNMTMLISADFRSSDIIELFNTIRKFEKYMDTKTPFDLFEAPWSKPVPPLLENVTKTVLYPNDAEERGTLSIGWRGPLIIEQLREYIALKSLLTYISGTDGSPFSLMFIDKGDASYISTEYFEYSTSSFYINFKSVPKDRMQAMAKEIICALQAIGQDDDNTPESLRFDYSRMKTMLEKRKASELAEYEHQPHKNIVALLIPFILYGKYSGDFNKMLNLDYVINSLLNEPRSFWINLLNKYLVNKPSVTIYLIPSKDEDERRSTKEKQRLESQIIQLGVRGRKKKADKLLGATECNLILPPINLLKSFRVPPISDINFITIDQYHSEDNRQHDKLNLQTCPTLTSWTNVDSAIVNLVVTLNTAKLQPEDRLFLPLYLEYILKCPMELNGVIVSYEKVTKEFEHDVISVKTALGLNPTNQYLIGKNSWLASIHMKVLKSKFQYGVMWLRRLLCNTVFDPKRISATVKKLAGQTLSIRQHGSSLSCIILKILLFKDETNFNLCSVPVQLRFIDGLDNVMNDDKQMQKIIESLNRVKKELSSPSAISFHIAANLESLMMLGLHDKQLHIMENELPIPRLTLPNDFEYLKSAEDKNLTNCVVGISGTDSSFLYRAVPAINDYKDENLPALLLFLTYISQMEGPLWRQVRGNGFAYSYKVIAVVTEGLLELQLSRASNIVEAYREAKEVIELYSSNRNVWDELQFESAKSSLIHNIVDKEGHNYNAAMNSIYSFYQPLGQAYNRELIKLVYELRMEKMLEIGDSYMMNLFDKKKSSLVVICHESNGAQIANDFKRFGDSLKFYPSVEAFSAAMCPFRSRIETHFK